MPWDHNASRVRGRKHCDADPNISKLVQIEEVNGVAPQVTWPETELGFRRLRFKRVAHLRKGIELAGVRGAIGPVDNMNHAFPSSAGRERCPSSQ
ncbi:MAG: hypothetical protein ACJ8IR_06755 [Alphaproteobacteria bacterium]